MNEFYRQVAGEFDSLNEECKDMIERAERIKKNMQEGTEIADKCRKQFQDFTIEYFSGLVREKNDNNRTR